MKTDRSRDCYEKKGNVYLMDFQKNFIFGKDIYKERKNIALSTLDLIYNFET
jgi:hypothetical protein